MIFITDVNIEFSKVSYLRQGNINITAARDIMKGSSNADIL